ncbi:hypothetical protein V8C26DRAFT_111363 [Trichoderma gracile]
MSDLTAAVPANPAVCKQVAEGEKATTMFCCKSANLCEGITGYQVSGIRYGLQDDTVSQGLKDVGGGTRYSIAPPSSSDQRSFNSCLLHRHHFCSSSPSSQRTSFQHSCSETCCNTSAGRQRANYLAPSPSPSPSPSPGLPASLPVLDESHPPCASGPSSPCHPLHREPCESTQNRAFGICTEAGGHRGPSCCHCHSLPAVLTNHLVAFFSLSLLSVFLFLSFSLSKFPALRLSFSLTPRSLFAEHRDSLPFWLLARSSAAAANHQLDSVSPVTSALRPALLVASCTARVSSTGFETSFILPFLGGRRPVDADSAQVPQLITCSC